MYEDNSVQRWLVRIGLGQYAEKFVEQNIDLADLPDLADRDLAELGVSIGHRKKFRRALEAPAVDGNSVPGISQPEASGFSDAERRQITVLFADLVGSTEWTTRLDPEDMRDIISAYQAACAREIKKFEGFVARFAGDGILAYFGYPLSHENDPELCVRAALGIVDAMSELNEWVAPAHGARLEVRIGVATGVVVVGDLIGEGTVEQRSVVGGTPNLAARLQTLAEPDAIVVSPSTRLLLGGLFRIQSLGEHRIKGIADAVEVWRILGAEAPESRFVASHASDLTTLVGRDPEILELQRCWAEVRGCTPHALLISGEPGSGKSRLIQEFRRSLEGESHNCLVIQCWSHTENSALLPIIEMIHRVLRFAQEDDNDQRLIKLEASLADIDHSDEGLTQLFASLLDIDTGDRYPPLRLSADAQKRETFIALVKIFGALAAREPTLVVVEDIHWIDPSTREFISFLWPRLDTERLMLLASIRTGHLDRWPVHDETHRIELRPISADDTRTLIGYIAGQSALPEALVDRIVHRTDGVPLFIEELTRLVVSGGEGNIKDEEAIPSTLHDLLLARLAQLTWEREVAMLCAALGRRFDDSLIEAVWRGEPAILREGLAMLVDAGILSRRQTGRTAFYTFRHVLIQEAAYSSLLRSDRSLLHRNIAEVLERRYTDGVLIQPEVLADHFARSGNSVKAAEYFLVAGQNSSKRSANLEAISHLNRALDLVAELPENGATLQLELGILVAISSPLVRTRGYAAPEAERTLVRARELCSRLGDSPQLIAVLCGLSIFSQARGDLHQARELAEQAHDLSEKANDDALRLLSCRSLGGAAFWQGDLEHARRCLQRGVEIYDPATHGALAYVYFVDPGVVCHSTLALDLWTLGQPERAMSHAVESVKLAEAIYHPYSVGFAKLYLATLNQVRQETELARDYAAEVVELSEAQVLPQGIAWGNVILGWATTRLGDPGKGEALISKGMQLWRQIGTRLILPYFLSLYSDACLDSGEHDKGLGAIGEALVLAGDTGEQCWQSELYRLRGEHRLVRQMDGTSTAESAFVDIETDFRLALADANKRKAKSLELRAACSLAHFLRLRGRNGEAEALLSSHCLQWADDVKSADLREAKSMLRSF